MDKATLVDQQIDAGRRLIEALDRENFSVVAALWTYRPEEGDWRLLLASPVLGKVGPRAAYALVQKYLAQAKIELPLHHISVVLPEHALVTELRIFAGTDPAPFIGSAQFRNVVMGDMYLDDVYLYRATRIVGKSGAFPMLSGSPDKQHKTWTAHECKVFVEEGFLKKIEVDGQPLPQSEGRNGINAQLWVLTNVDKQNGSAVGDVTRWVIRDGRLRAIDLVARDVRIEGETVAEAAH